MEETTTPTPTSSTSSMEKRMKKNVNKQGVMIPCLMMAVLMDNLMWSHSDKKDATHDEGIYCSNRYYKLNKKNMIKLRESIIESMMNDEFCGTLYEHAPDVSRLYIEMHIRPSDVRFTDVYFLSRDH